jgi:uncharacterized membrane protein YoaT (DUF817 family)
MKIDRFPLLHTCHFLRILSALRYGTGSYTCLYKCHVSLSLSSLLLPWRTALSFTKHDAPFRTTEKCGAMWPPHTVILSDITGTETRQTWQTWWLCPALFTNGKLPYSSIDFYADDLFVALRDIGLCAYCLCCQDFSTFEASATSHPPYLLLKLFNTHIPADFYSSGSN